MECSRPWAPILAPIQKVKAAPATEPTVASSAAIHGNSPPRAAMITTAASMPPGNAKKIVESSAASQTMPNGDAMSPTIQVERVFTPAHRSNKSAMQELDTSTVNVTHAAGHARQGNCNERHKEAVEES